MVVNINLNRIAEKSGYSSDRLKQILSLLNPDSKFTGVGVVFPRLLSVYRWLHVFDSEFIDEDIFHDLLIIDNYRSKWEYELAKEFNPKSNNRNLLDIISKHPLYAIFTEQIGSETQESLVSPFIALFILAYKRGQFSSDSDVIVKARGVRKQIYDDSILGRRLKAAANSEKIIAGDVGKFLYIIQELKKHLGLQPWILKIIEVLGISFEDPVEKNKFPKSCPNNVVEEGRIKRVRKKRIYKRKDIQVEGLSTIETGEEEEVITAPPAAEYDIDLVQRKLSNRYEMENQYLLSNWAHLNNKEISWIRGEIEKLIQLQDPLGLILALMTATARSAGEVTTFYVLNQNRDLNNKELSGKMWLSISEGLWIHSVFEPDQAWKPDEKTIGQVFPTVDLVHLYLPNIVKDACSIFLTNAVDKTHLGKNLNISPAEAEIMVDDWCRLARNRSGFSRITTKRIQNWVMQQILGVTQDLPLVSHQFWIDPGSSAAIYYASFPLSELQRQYSIGVKWILGDCPTNGYNLDFVGSNLVVPDSTIRKWVDNCKNEIKRGKGLKGIDKIIEVHNHFTAYLLLINFFVTGHRNVIDPFERNNFFDKVAGIAVITDKVDGTSDDGRLVWLCDTLIKQLEGYKKHLVGLASRLKSYERNFALRVKELVKGSREQDLPYFFFLEKKNYEEQSYVIPAQITPTKLAEILDINLPMNWPRHYLATKLREKGVSIEYVNYQLDHMQIGQRFDNPYSVLSVSDLKEALQPVLDDLCLQMGMTYVEGLRSYPTRDGKIDYQQTYWKIGSKSREERRSKTRNKIRKRIRSVLSGFDVQQIGEKEIIKLGKKLKSEFKNNSERYMATLSCYRLITRKRPSLSTVIKKNWELSKPIVKEKSAFNLKHIERVKRGRLHRACLQKWCEETLDNDLEENEWKAMVVASAILEGGLVKGCYQKQLVEQIVDRMNVYINVWYDLEDNSYRPSALRRWIPDLLSSKLLLSGYEKYKDTSKITFGKIKKIIVKKLKVTSFDNLVIDSIELYRSELPQILIAYITGKLQSASLPTDTLIRMISGQRFDYIKEKDKRIRYKPPSKIFSKVLDKSYLDGLKIVSDARELINEAIEGPEKKTREQLYESLQKLIVDNQNIIPPIFSAFMEWVVEIIMSGRKKDELAISSVRTYFGSVASHLYESCWKINEIRDLNGEKYIDLYTEALDFTTKRNRPSNASLYEDYHHYLSANYGVVKIDFDIIEPNRKGRSVRPNFLSSKEYNRVKNRIEPAYQTPLILACKARLRGKEIRSLAVKDLLVDDDPIVIVRSVAGRKTKTKAGQRQVGLKNKIEADEYDQLKITVNQAVKDRVQYLANAFPADYYTRLQEVVREETGDTNFVMYDMRHTGVSNSIIRSILPKEEWPQGVTGLVEESNIERNEPTLGWFDVESKTRRYLYYESQQTGHSSPHISISSYMHVLDWVLNRLLVRQQTFNYELENKLSKIDKATLRKRKSRSVDGKYQPSVFETLVNKSDIKPPARVEELIDVEEYFDEERAITIQVILESIRLAKAGNDTIAISRTIGIDPKQVGVWVDRIQEVEMNTGFSINRFINKKNWLNVDFSYPVKMLIEKLITMNRDTEDMDFLVNRFIYKYKPREDTFVLDKDEDIVRLLAILTGLGIEKKGIKLIVPENHSINRQDCNEETIYEKFKLYKVRVIKRDIVARTWKRRVKLGIGLQADDVSKIDQRIRVQSEINMALFAACCFKGI